MADVRVSAALRDAEVVVGGSLVVEATLTSIAAGNKLVEVQHPEGESRFEYELASAEHGRFVVSKRLYDRERLVHPPPPMAPMRQPLAPGGSQTYVEDVAAYFVTAPPPGEYALTVRWMQFDGQTAASEPLRVRIVPIAARAVAQIVERSGVGVVAVFVHATAGGEDVVLARAAEPGRPDLGRARPWGRGRGITSVAVATEADDPVEWRWIAWTEAGTLGGAIVWGDEVMRRIDASPHGLEDARLLESGWQSADGEGLFAIAGARAGRGVVDIVHVPKGAAPRHDHFDLGTPPPARLAAAAWHAAAGVVEIVRVDATPQGAAVATQRLDLAKPGQAGPLQLLATLPGEVLALEVAPLLGDAPCADVLAGNASGLTYARLALSPGAPAATWTLDAPPGRATAWAIAPLPHPTAPVVAVVDRALWSAAAARGGGWSKSTESAHGVRLPRIVHLTPPDGSGPPNRLYVTWFDDLWGYSVRALDETA